MNCRTRKRKEEICSQYYIQPVNYIQLLEGQTKEGCCGPLDDKYYIFSYRPRGDYNIKPKYFFVGTHCANEFLDIINHKALTLFNPLAIDSNGSSSSTGLSKGSDNFGKLNPFNQELLSAINMLCITWDIIPESGLVDIITYTKKFSDTPNTNGLEWFNNMVSKDGLNRSLRQMIDTLRQKNKLKDLKYDRLNQYLNDHKMENHIG
ncbi:hypothetical protein SAMN04488029_3394 [Reichenbachiella faecimaris]|uniref:Uncharacterized protein n=1 Tax=Reichenbachiella faecimaris TaxID=692418 RepID=A0A1W2GN24_REIFA|nr:hypothetical protein [Reichenbachiella faecimaris]SMD37656.1 hypothetical protein SAMN04488029_3394 [Reichenbachiella faecimaris]